MNLTSGVSGLGAEFVRVRRLNCDGTVIVPADGAECETAGYATCKFTEITVTPEVLEGETFQQNNGGGRLCVNVQRDDQTTGYTWELEQCDVDYEFKEILGVVDTLLVNSTGDTIGAEWKGGATSCDCGSTTVCRNIALEFWVRAYRCSEAVGYIRHIIPLISFTQGTNTVTYGNAILLERFSGRSKPNTEIPTGGPWSDAPAGVVLTGNGPAEFFETAVPPFVVDAAEEGSYIPCDFHGSPTSG